MSVWGMGLAVSVASGAEACGPVCGTAFRPERKTPHSARDVVVI